MVDELDGISEDIAELLQLNLTTVYLSINLCDNYLRRDMF